MNRPELFWVGGVTDILVELSRPQLGQRTRLREEGFIVVFMLIFGCRGLGGDDGGFLAWILKLLLLQGPLASSGIPCSLVDLAGLIVLCTLTECHHFFICSEEILGEGWYIPTSIFQHISSRLS